MFCRFCGKELDNRAKFCSACGRPQSFVGSIKTDKLPTTVWYAVAILFILSGILPYLLQDDYNQYFRFLLSTGYSSEMHAVVLAFGNFSSMFSFLFYFPSSFLTIFLGLLMLKKESNLNFPLMVCGVAHVVSAVYSIVLNLIIYCFPEFVISLFVNDSDAIEMGKEILKTEPKILYYYQNDALRRMVISVIFISLAILVVYLRRQYADETTDENNKTASVGSVAMIISISFLPILFSKVVVLFKYYFFGIMSDYINNQARACYNQNINHGIATLVFALVICVAVLFTRIKWTTLSVCITGVFLIIGVLLLLFSNYCVRDGEYFKEFLPLIVKRYRNIIIGETLFYIAMFFWFCAVSRNKIPRWLQIVLPILIPVVYVGIELLTTAHIRVGAVFFWGIIGIDAVIILLSLAAIIRNRGSINT